MLLSNNGFGIVFALHTYLDTSVCLPMLFKLHISAALTLISLLWNLNNEKHSLGAFDGYSIDMQVEFYFEQKINASKSLHRLN